MWPLSSQQNTQYNFLGCVFNLLPKLQPPLPLSELVGGRFYWRIVVEYLTIFAGLTTPRTGLFSQHFELDCEYFEHTLGGNFFLMPLAVYAYLWTSSLLRVKSLSALMYSSSFLEQLLQRVRRFPGEVLSCWAWTKPLNHCLYDNVILHGWCLSP